MSQLKMGLVLVLVCFIAMEPIQVEGRVFAQGDKIILKTMQESENKGSAYVKTSYGRLRGKREVTDSGQVLDVYLGVPYAKPPVGKLRFSSPIRPSPWKHTRDALAHGPQCLQRIIAEDPPLTNVPFSEDCLYLDVYTSRSQSATGLQPVMFYIHGGGYFGGTGDLYNFTNVALREVVVVAINYRLDVFGFLSTSDDVIPGNFGMLDQILAMDWVKEEIEAFGGNPNDVTIFGGSAGAGSVGLHLLSPLSKGKFHKGIMQSGTAIAPWAMIYPEHQVTPLAASEMIGLGLGCSLPSPNSAFFSRALLYCLRNKSGQQIITASRIVQKLLGNFIIWAPVIENSFGFMPERPLRLLQQGRFTPLPTLQGYSTNDMSYLVADPDNKGLSMSEFKMTTLVLITFLEKSRATEIYEDVLDLYLPEAFRSDVTPIELRSILMEIVKDMLMTSGMIHSATLYKDASKPSNQISSFFYEFAHRPSYTTEPKWRGVIHTSEKGFVLGLPLGPDPFSYPSHTEKEEQLSDFVVTLWTNFAKTGNPTPTPVEGITWPVFSPESSRVGCDATSMSPCERLDNEYMLKINLTSEVIPFHRDQKLQFWIKTLYQGKAI